MIFVDKTIFIGDWNGNLYSLKEENNSFVDNGKIV